MVSIKKQSKLKLPRCLKHVDVNLPLPAIYDSKTRKIKLDFEDENFPQEYLYLKDLN